MDKQTTFTPGLVLILEKIQSLLYEGWKIRRHTEHDDILLRSYYVFISPQRSTPLEILPTLYNMMVDQGRMPITLYKAAKKWGVQHSDLITLEDAIRYRKHETKLVDLLKKFEHFQEDQ